MEIVKIDLNDEETYQPVIKKAVDFLKEGRVIVFPTDTVYNLGASMFEDEAIERIFKIRKCLETKPLPLFIKNIAMAKDLAFIDKRQEEFLKAVWPGPVTVLLEKKRLVSDILTRGQKTVGLRIPDFHFIADLLKKLNQPLAQTSVNISGQPSLNSAQDIINLFKESEPGPDLIIDAGGLSDSLPPTIMNLTGSEPRILRVGPVGKKELLEILGN